MRPGWTRPRRSAGPPEIRTRARAGPRTRTRRSRPASSRRSLALERHDPCGDVAGLGLVEIAERRHRAAAVADGCRDVVLAGTLPVRAHIGEIARRRVEAAGGRAVAAAGGT